MLDSVWILLVLLQGPAPVPAPPLPTVVDACLLTVSALVSPPLTAPPPPQPVVLARAKPPASERPEVVKGKAELSYVSTGGSASTQTLGEDRTRGRGRYLGTFDVGVRHRWEIAKHNTISNDASFKTDVDRTSDWRVSHVAALQAGLNAVLALKLSHEINYRNEPAPGFTRADTVAAAAIVATF